ncbi:TetR/AcrR family transcriptional regulator [Corynebacterium ulceribovis]|uniref:TetR/AcrR family transcriptional regulator n=1 Tax=Corynebacterium ulceribovis TaxID=487732 RepID=UPI00037CE518|nr:TetR/AcrR family transcriptional regulator [Corynebacterium ulceribovis]
MDSVRERKKAETRSRLAAAAAELILAGEPDGATVRAISEHAGVSTRTFHNYFTCREEALFHFVAEVVAAWTAQIESVPAQLGARKAMHVATMNMFNQPENDPRYPANLTLLGEHLAHVSGAENRRRAYELYAPLRAAMVSRNGDELSEMEAQVLIDAVIAAVGAVLTWSQLGLLGADENFVTAADQALTVICRER